MKKTLIFVFALAIFASVFLCQTAAAQSVEPWNVQFEVRHETSSFSYNLRDEIGDFVQNSEARGFFLGKNGKIALAKRLLADGLPNLAVFNYLLPNFQKVVEHFGFVERQRKDATVSFDENGFRYETGWDGVAVEVDKLFWQALQSGGKKIVIALPVVVDKAISVQEVKNATVLKGTFTTRYPSSGAARRSNLQLATKALDGTVVKAGEKFSFNQAVGPRTAERGYKTAKVISDGVYVDGVGGGVCQVSTTLYNALLLSEFVPSACQHSLISSYVEAGFDAMVSDGGADLTFVNDTDSPVYISAKTNAEKSTVTFTVYGKPNRYKVVRESVAERTPFETVEIFDEKKYPDLVFDDEFKVIVNGSDGVQSQSFLNYFDGSVLVKRIKIRKNTYKKVNKVVARGTVPRQSDN